MISVFKPRVIYPNTAPLLSDFIESMTMHHLFADLYTANDTHPVWLWDNSMRRKKAELAAQAAANGAGISSSSTLLDRPSSLLLARNSTCVPSSPINPPATTSTTPQRVSPLPEPPTSEPATTSDLPSSPPLLQTKRKLLASRSDTQMPEPPSSPPPAPLSTPQEEYHERLDMRKRACAAAIGGTWARDVQLLSTRTGAKRDGSPELGGRAAPS